MKKNGKLGITITFAAASNSSPTGVGPDQRGPSEHTGMAGVIASAHDASDSAGPRDGKCSSKSLVVALEEENLQLRDQVLGLALTILDLQTQSRPGERTRWDDIGRRQI